MTETAHVSSQKKSRFYTKPSLESSRGFSASAAKRNSVLALGSINHLQHFFVKQAAKAAPAKNAQCLPGLELLQEDEELSLDVLPPSPDPPTSNEDLIAPIERPKSLKELRQESWQAVDNVCQTWRIVDHVKSRRPSTQDASVDAAQFRSQTSSPAPSSSKSVIDDSESESLIVDLMKTTTDAIRAVQKLMLSLPTQTPHLEHLSMNDSLSTRHQSQMGVSTAARPRTSIGLPLPPRQSSLAKAKTEVEDGPSSLRRSSLDLLGLLREMDTKYRLPTELNSDETSDLLDNEEAENGHLYRDVKLDDLTSEKEQVQKWIQLVDAVLFASLRQDPSSILVESPVEDFGPIRIISSPPDQAMHDDRLPLWARDNAFEGDQLRRAHALLTTYLPASIIFRLIPPHTEDGSREEFLESLSDGQLLCQAFNGAVSRSERPWGFIQTDSIHVLPTEQTSRRQSSETSQPKVGMTFRKLENLQMWVAAIKLRYGVLLGSSAAALRDRGSSKEALVDVKAAKFDSRQIARREVGWQDMLEYALFQFVEAVVKETREVM